MATAGGIFKYTTKLHENYGPVAAFWWGEQKVVSVASPDLWKDIQGLFDRPRKNATNSPLVLTFNKDNQIILNKLINKAYVYFEKLKVTSSQSIMQLFIEKCDFFKKKYDFKICHKIKK